MSSRRIVSKTLNFNPREKQQVLFTRPILNKSGRAANYKTPRTRCGRPLIVRGEPHHVPAICTEALRATIL
jgi:hypothetical protein